MKRLCLLLIVPLLLTSCSTVRKTLGGDQAPPDEFAVVERAPLTMPPDFNLLPPRPGTPRPQETHTEAAAKTLVLGNGVAATKDMSEGEKSFLTKAGAAGADPKIRQELADPLDDQEVDGTVMQQLGITDGAKVGKALNPNKEIKRLKKQNISAPDVDKAKAVRKAAEEEAKKKVD